MYFNLVKHINVINSLTIMYAKLEIEQDENTLILDQD